MTAKLLINLNLSYSPRPRVKNILILISAYSFMKKKVIRTDLEKLFNPRSIAIIGASNTPGKTTPSWKSGTNSFSSLPSAL